ncbi:MAG: aminotransferase class III-fold pyridoxal phosphate-dependent enzyme [Actinomycetia bacterium]|nr:aminotransferase class III-fold pyridoxal phosphate-dependent enzyme [Actinomycetes bacterium]
MTEPTPSPRAAADLDAAVASARAGYVVQHRGSATANDRARVVMPGGNTRSVLHFDPFPFRVTSAADATLIDVDGHSYVDFCGNYTAGLLGHSPGLVRDAIIEALDQGWAVGATHSREIELAELVCERFASIEQVRFTNSGTEANLMAIGAALHHTGRTGVGVFDHAYHGGVLGFGDLEAERHHPLNVPHRFIIAPFDDEAGLDGLFSDTDLGCVVIEAVQGSGGCRPASPGFLTELRRRCDETGTVLIFDEAMTSRLAAGGAQQRFGVLPDMTTLGKYLGGGMTFGAFGGRHHLMAHFDPLAGGALTQAGTFNNNVVSMAAAIATLRHGLDTDVLDAVNARGDRLREELDAVFSAAERPVSVSDRPDRDGGHHHDPDAEGNLLDPEHLGRARRSPYRHNIEQPDHGQSPNRGERDGIGYPRHRGRGHGQYLSQIAVPQLEGSAPSPEELGSYVGDGGCGAGRDHSPETEGQRGLLAISQDDHGRHRADPHCSTQLGNEAPAPALHVEPELNGDEGAGHHQRPPETALPEDHRGDGQGHDDGQLHRGDPSRQPGAVEPTVTEAVDQYQLQRGAGQEPQEGGHPDGEPGPRRRHQQTQHNRLEGETPAPVFSGHGDTA